MIRLKIYDDLLELADQLLTKYPMFLPMLNDHNPDDWSVRVPEINFHFIPLTKDSFTPTITHNNRLYSYMSVNGVLTGYGRQRWLEKSPIPLYPVFYSGQYTGNVFLTPGKALEYIKGVKDELVDEGLMGDITYENEYFKEYFDL